MFKNIDMDTLDAAYNRVRRELEEVRLLKDGKYLDRIQCVRSPLPSGWWNEAGYVFDGGVGLLNAFLGYEAGCIYIPANAPTQAYVPGGTLTDTIRHEFAHAWAWLDRSFVDGPWFRKAFGARYDDEWDEDEQADFDPDNFVSDYATTLPKEDFAETFMFYLKYRRSLKRFDRRPGLARKLHAVEKAVEVAAQERMPRIRGPRK